MRDIIEGVESGAEDIIDGAGDAADVTTIDSASEITAADSTTEAVTKPEVTTEAMTTMPEVTTSAGLVNGDNNVNTGFVLTFTALGAAAAGLILIST